MERAAILIGVKKTGNLPELQAATSGVQQMAQWARLQGIPDSRIKVLTDESGEVRIHQISDAIEAVVGLTTVEQLIVYFSGHGVNNRGEYWLLSRAPANPNEAVNVNGSVQVAGYCGIRHIVLISDACRTAAEGIQAQHVEGGNIFPNEPVSGLENPVDVFFACARGKPALEVKEPIEAARRFSALYTDVLVEYLKGKHPEVLDYEEEEGIDVGLVRPRKLKDRLRDSVSTRLKEKLGAAPTINQTPDARITSENTWLSRIPGVSRPATPVVPVSRAAPINPFTVSEALVSHAIAGDLKRWRDVLTVAGGLEETSLLRDSAITYTTAFGPSHFETNCGFKLRGGEVARALCKETSAEILDAEGTIIRVRPMPRPGTAVLLELKNGTGVLVPAIQDFVAELTFENNELVNVSYEPSDYSSRWGEYANRLGELRTLRASIAASVGLGVFRLSGDDALKLARHMQIAKGVDPSMALYAAYAYHDLQRRDLIKEMQSYLRGDVGLTFFDISLLSGERPGKAAGLERVVPPFPMLGQGWTLLSAFRAELAGSLRDLRQHLLPGLWTMFDTGGLAKLAAAIQSGEIK
jgi:hypothetical protein